MKEILSLLFTFLSLSAMSQQPDEKIQQLLNNNPEAQALYNEYLATTDKQTQINQGKEMLELLPYSYLGFQMIGRAYYNLNEYGIACPYFQQAESMGGDNSEEVSKACAAYGNSPVGKAYQLLLDGNYNAALQAYQQVLAENPDDWGAAERYMYWKAYDILEGKEQAKPTQQENQKLALDYFRLIVALNPNSSAAYSGLGEAYYKNNDKKNAYLNFKKALEINPENYTVNFEYDMEVLEEEFEER